MVKDPNHNAACHSQTAPDKSNRPAHLQNCCLQRSGNSKYTMSSDDALFQLTAMGFHPSQAQEALAATSGDLEQAVNVLLGGVTVAAQPASQSLLVTCDTSQYSVNHGRSACTCIALMGAALFLQSNQKTVTSELLNSMVHQGVETYQQLPVSGEVEHLSPEEVLQQHIVEEFKPLSLQGGVRQGYLCGQENHPLGLHALLHACQVDASQQWVAVLITKPPETVVVLLPPTPAGEYILLDSHPRPGLDTAYARIHSSLQDLVQSLEAIYPVTDLGPDVPEIMAAMYNSFDLYPLLWKQEITEDSL